MQVSGVLVMALPIPIVVDNFGNYYAEQKKLEAAELKKEAQEKVREVERQAEVVANKGLLGTITGRGGQIRSPSLISVEETSRTEQTTLTVTPRLVRL